LPDGLSAGHEASALARLIAQCLEYGPAAAVVTVSSLDTGRQLPDILRMACVEDAEVRGVRYGLVEP